jgi:hypothetical protein
MTQLAGRHVVLQIKPGAQTRNHLRTSDCNVRQPGAIAPLRHVLAGNRDGPGVFSTPTGTRFADLDELERLTGQPVRWEYRMPGTGERTPPADAVLACPLTFNSVNKNHGCRVSFAFPWAAFGRLIPGGGAACGGQAAHV